MRDVLINIKSLGIFIKGVKQREAIYWLMFYQSVDKIVEGQQSLKSLCSLKVSIG